MMGKGKDKKIEIKLIFTLNEQYTITYMDYPRQKGFWNRVQERKLMWWDMELRHLYPFIYNAKDKFIETLKNHGLGGCHDELIDKDFQVIDGPFKKYLCDLIRVEFELLDY